MSIGEAKIKLLKSKIDCRELIKGYGISFQNQNISCLNSAHPDKNPSMAVYHDNVYCFGCGFNLDAIGIVQHMQDLNFQDACQYLAEKHGLNIEKKKTYNFSPKITKPEKKFEVKKSFTPKKEFKTNQKTSDFLNQFWNLIKDLNPTESSISWFHKRKISLDFAWVMGCRDITPALEEIKTLFQETPKHILEEYFFINKMGEIWSPIAQLLKGYKLYSGLLLPIFDENDRLYSFRWRFYEPIQSVIKTQNGQKEIFKKVIGQPFCESKPIGLNLIKSLDKKEALYICEGEPDFLSVNTCFHENKIKDKIAIGLCPLTWNEEWSRIVSQFSQVYICLHDTEKAIHLTEKIALSLIKSEPQKIDHWKRNFFRKLFSEDKDANDLLVAGHLLDYLPSISGGING